MTFVFVHGVPETAAIWDDLRGRLQGNSIALELPGFGGPRPDGFAATMDDYAEWLLGALEHIEGPVDLVGHDWGGILTTRVATIAPDRLRSWVTDAVTAVHPDFTWHEFAKIWQSPGAGEKYWEDLRSSPADSAAVFAALGVPEADARAMVAAIDATMVGCILDLYRSAVDIGRSWQASGPLAAPGLVLIGGDDPFGDLDRSRSIGRQLGADVAVLEGAGHWWPLQAAQEGAQALESFWASLDSSPRQRSV
jgi:pimeloyl-ACP methyl ester carboxylesterase